MGREWYENGKFFNKKNTFTDFISCAEALIENGYPLRQSWSSLAGAQEGC